MTKPKPPLLKPLPTKVNWEAIKSKAVTMDIEFNHQRAATEIAIKADGRSIVDTLVKPVRSLDIAGKMLKKFDTGHIKMTEFTKAPEFREVQPSVEAGLRDQVLFGYNICGDLNILNDNRAAIGLPPLQVGAVVDLMRVFRGMRDRSLWLNHSLTDVLGIEGVPLKPGIAHRAGWDAEATLDLARWYVNLLGMEMVLKYGLVQYEYKPVTKRTYEMAKPKIVTSPTANVWLGLQLYQGVKDNAPRLRDFLFVNMWKGPKGATMFNVMDRNEGNKFKMVAATSFKDQWGRAKGLEIEQQFLDVFSR